MRTILIATRNKGKLREMKKILKDLEINIKSLDELGIKDDIEETGKSYEENAILKAKTIGDKTRVMTLGEDSGLEIDALDGWPGIKSARHTSGTDQDRIDVILKKITDIPDSKRSARYIASIALYNPQTKEIKIFKGETEGRILGHMVGTKGFGYDPIFWSSDLKKTFAEASQEEKDKVSHRGRALRHMAENLRAA